MGLPRRLAFAFLACFCCLAQSRCASTVIFRTDAQLVALSERVVHGRVIGQRTARGGPQGLRIYTVTTLQIIEDLTGVDGETVEMWELGGRIGDEFLYVGGAVQYRVGEEVLVCLERGPQGLRSVAMGFSKFDVLPEVNGERRLRRDLRETVVVGGAVCARAVPLRAAHADVERDGPAVPPRPCAARRRRASSRSNSRSRCSAGRPAGDGSRPIRRRRSLGTSTRARPRLADRGWRQRAPDGLAAWTNPASASIVLQYGGTTMQTSADGFSPGPPWAGLPAGGGVVTFEDPNNEISGSTLAIGGGCGDGGTGGTVNGVTFNGFSRGYVIFQNAVDLEQPGPASGSRSTTRAC